jgi:hypothetical protein
MAGNITPLPHSRDFDFTPGATNLPGANAEQRTATIDDARIAADDDAEAMRRLAPSPSRAMMVGGGIAAVLLGGAIGFWLGGRRVSRAPAKVRHAASTADSLIELAPVAMHLLGNPMIRRLAVRMLLRQITSRLPS